VASLFLTCKEVSFENPDKLILSEHFKNTMEQQQQQKITHSHFCFLFVYHISQCDKYSQHVDNINKDSEKERETGLQVVIVVALTGQLHDFDQLCIVIDCLIGLDLNDLQIQCVLECIE
jgi:hypothetical protein